MMSYPNPDIEKETVFPPCHCEHLKGACLHAVAAGFGTQAWQSDEVVARAQPVAISRAASLHSGQDFVSLAMTIL